MAADRAKKSIKNVVFSLSMYIIDLVLKFVTRTIFIKILAVELLGLNGLFSNILQVLSLAELGFGTALTCSMYKPVAENNTKQIIALYKYFKKIYLIIIAVMLSAGLLILPFIKYLIKGDVPAGINIYIVYSVYILNTGFSYLSAHNKSLLMAQQRNDLNSKTEILKTIFLNLFQIATLLLFKNYYIYILFLPLSALLEFVVISLIARKNFPELTKSKQVEKINTETKKEIKSNVFALLFHKIGGTLVTSTDNILISSLLGLAILGMYSNYYLVIMSLMMLLSAGLNALKGTIGNIINTENNQRIYGIFNKLNFAYSILVGFCSTCLLCLIQPFVKIWVGPEYLFETSTVILLVISFFLNTIKYMLYSFKECAGLLKQDKYRSIVEALINLGVSILLGKLIGINGIIIGTITCTLLGPFITEPYVTFKYLFKKSTYNYYLKLLLYAIVTTISCVAIWFLCVLIPDGGILYFLLKLVVVVVGSLLIMCVLLCWTKEFRDGVKWLFDSIKRMLPKHKRAQAADAEVANVASTQDKSGVGAELDEKTKE